MNKNNSERSVFVVGNCYRAAIINMLLEEGYKRAEDFDSADILLLTGGADVHPELYGEKKLNNTYCDVAQDQIDGQAYTKAKQQRKLVVGICRGAQFINVMNGGRLWQDVSNHACGAHYATELETGDDVFVTSLHHQECILAKKGVPLMVAKRAAWKKTYKVTWMRHMNPDAQDMEAFWYPDTFSFGYQPHPELQEKHESGRAIFFKYINRFWTERETFMKLHEDKVA